MDYTPAQVGDAAEPELHELSAIPAVIDETRDDDVQPLNYSPREVRSWRAVDRLGAVPGPATDDRLGALPEAHQNAGQADARRTGGMAGMTGTPHESLRPESETLSNGRDPEAINTQAPIDRPRAGSIGTDPTRLSFMPKWLFQRPFDKAAGLDHPSPIPKIPAASPIASRPLRYEDPIPHAVPSAGGSGATETESVHTIGSTVRVLPGQWDEAIVPVNEDAGVDYAAHQQRKGWRL